MGATTDFRTFKIADKKTVKAKFREECDEARYEHGHGGYTGTIAEMCNVETWRDLLLASPREAENHIEEHHEKHDGAMAVSFKYPDPSGGKTVFGWVVGGWCSE